MQYTNKDYESIFNYLKVKATELSNGQWTDFTDGDFGTIVIHLLSYWGDLLSNQLDLTASELFMSTAEERTSLMEIVKLIGYEPGHFQSAFAFTEFKYRRSEEKSYEPLTLPAFTKFLTTDNGLSYYNLYQTTLNDDITTVTLYEGTKVSKNAYFEDIDEYGRISLGDYYAATNTVQCSVVSGSVSGEIPRVTDVRFNTGEMCFSVHVSLDGIPYIQLPSFWSNMFSDPTTFSITYLATNGVDGRTGANTITKTTSSALSNYVINNPEASVGGYNPETVTEIKAKASVFARTMYSIVTLQDFEDMSLFINDIVQVKALDYNNDETDFPPTIPAYKQPSPPNGVPNDAYKVLIIAVPSDIGTQTIFSEENNYGKLTAAAQQLHDLYMERKMATLYVEYRDPVYIDPWLIMNVYMDENDLNISAVADDIINYLKVRYSRSRVKIGDSVYGSVVGKDILNSFKYVNYVEIRDPEYNIEAKPYEYIDVPNGYFMIFINDALKYVPKGLTLIRLRNGDEVRIKVDMEDSREESLITTIDYLTPDVYNSNNSLVPNSYKYLFDKRTGDYPRPELEKIGVLWEDNDKVFNLIIPNSMLQLGTTQSFYLENNEVFLHIFNDNGDISDVIPYMNESDGYNPPSYCSVEYGKDEGSSNEIMGITFTTDFTGVKVKEYVVNQGYNISAMKPNGYTYTWNNNIGAPSEPSGWPKEVHHEENGVSYIFYIPAEWEVSVNESV